jgi:methyl-accepting chemotaxis protein
MYLICQARAEIGQDLELAESMQDANIKMLYLGVESNNAENLKLVKKRQEPGQMEQDLQVLNEMDFSVVAMTIIGLPYDTEEDIMNLADWVTQYSKYQTANLLTPLPATSNWDSLTPLNENGELLAAGEIRPYHLYTGRQFVFSDERWSMEESRELFDRYSAKLTSIDNLYGRLFRMLRSYRLRLATSSRDLGDTITSRIGEATETIKNWADPISSVGQEFGENISVKLEELAETLKTVSQPLSNTRQDMVDNISVRVNELSNSLKELTDPVAASSKDIVTGVSTRINELTEILNGVLADSNRKTSIKQ